MVKYLSVNSNQTKKIAKTIGQKLFKKNKKKTALILSLKGGLGVGKTTFLQGFAKFLGIKEKVLSPTFVLMKKFSIFKSKFKTFYHIDCYRIEKPKEILDLGFNEIIKKPENIIAIEWPEKIKKILAKNKNMVKIKIDFYKKKKNYRKITIKF